MQSREFELKTTLKFREAKANDAEDLHLYCFAHEKLEDIEEELKSDLEKMKKDRLYRLVVDASDHAVANIRMERGLSDPDIGKISRLAVSVPFRTFNLADRLIDAIYDIAVENGIKIIQVDIPKSEKNIIEAYKKWDFAERDVVTLQREVELKKEDQQEADDASEEDVEENEEKTTQLDLEVNDAN